jgi:hypothetical protein
MTSPISRSLALVVFLCGFAVVCPGQDPAKPDPEVKEKLSELKKLAGQRKGVKDSEAIAVISDLEVKFAKMHPKDQKAYAKGLGAVLTGSRIKRKPVQDQIFRTCILALGRAGKLGSPFLAKAFDSKKFKDKDWVNLRGQMLEHLGRTKDSKYIKFLLDEALKNISDTLMAKAGGALKYYTDEKLSVRKDTCKNLIKKFAQIHDNGNTNIDPGDSTVAMWKNKERAVSEPWNATLQKLTKQHLRGPDSWTKFWNKHKSKNWDKPIKTSRR